MFVSRCFITNASTMFLGEFVHICIYKYPVLHINHNVNDHEMLEAFIFDK